MKVSLEDIKKAKQVIAPVIKHTPVDISVSASKLLSSEVFFKYENQQMTGSFKIRGAYNKISNLSAEEKSRGVVASSAGNHAQGVAFSATKQNVKSTIVMPKTAPLIKIAATKDYGADVVLAGEIYDEAYEHARLLEKEKGYVFVHPFEDPHVIAGQGTIGLEIIEELKDLESIVIPIGGGGLISGIATAVKALNPKCKIFGVQSEATPGMEKLFHKQSYQEPKKRVSTIADGIAVKRPSQIMYDNFISKLVDEIVTVSDDEIAEAIVFLMERNKTVAEGSGAAGMAAAMNGKLKLGKKTCILLGGGNIDLNMIAKVIEQGLTRKGRLVELSVVVDDLPGNLNRLTAAIADLRANILQVHHDRVFKGLHLRETRINFLLETTSQEHVEQIRTALLNAGARVS
ncbi:MAG: threonine ammonia-lyase [Pseudobdellovibrionaceae bacterium]